MDEIKEKDIQIKELKSTNPYNLKPGENLMTIIFQSDEKQLHYAMICKKTDKFSTIEQKLYDLFPECSEEGNYFLHNGMKISRFKSLEDNNIKNSGVINLFEMEFE